MDEWPKVAEIAKKVRTGDLKAVDLVKKSLGKIEETKDYEVVISTCEKRAISRAEAIDKKPYGRLAGVPFVAKDNFLTLEGKTTAASNILKPYEAVYQATAIEKLEAEGAICVAKVNLDAFGHGGSTENSDFFVTKNPKDKTRVPGGSSGGSAAAVALNIAPFAIGTDTGGSTRQPASFCGCYGFKPTYGLISRSGVVAMASSADTIGTFTNNTEDLSLVIDVMAGRDELDSTTIERDPLGYELKSPGIDLKKQKIGVIKEFLADGINPGVKEQIQKSIDRIKSSGAQIEEISLPSISYALAVYYIVVSAEISSNLSRYDGQRYGYSVPLAKDLDDSYFLSREQGFGAEAKRRIMIGTYVLSTGYYDAYYKKAQTIRTKIINEFADAFKQVDFLLGPTSPTIAFKIGERSDDPLEMYLSDVLTVAPSLAGLPAMNVPAGEYDGLPVGLQLIAPQKSDRVLLQLTKEVKEVIK
jgi:aspartyl-tRNA(Asn)/glutamyl-tRNA(Gln) amidotransferase subunit A